MPRKYTHIKAVENEIHAMRAEGKTRQEIADEFGLTKKQVKDLITRHNRRQTAIEEGKMPTAQGRPRARARTAEEEKAYELKQLRMENELLRDFLRLAGRR
jgi:transposase